MALQMHLGLVSFVLCVAARGVGALHTAKPRRSRTYGKQTTWNVQEMGGRRIAWTATDTLTRLRAGADTDAAETTSSGSSTTPTSKMETLTFVGDFTYTSQPLPASATKEQIKDFFTSDKTKRLLASAGGKRPSKDEELTPELRQYWEDCCEQFYGPESLPEEGDGLLSCENVIHFPGIELVTTVCTATKLIKKRLSKSENDRGVDDIPQHEFLLIAEKQQAFGPKPIKWIFNQLTGIDKDAKDKFNPPRARAKSHIRIVETEDSEKGRPSYAISFDVNLQVLVSFPKVLVKIMPASKEKMEERGSASVAKAISKDVVAAIDATRDAFIQELEEATQP